MALVPEAVSKLLEGGFEVAGPLEMFASAGGIHVARAVAEFGIDTVVSGRAESRDVIRPGEPPAAAGSSGRS